MINVTSYFLYNLSNLLIIILIPSDVASDYLNIYSVGSGIFSFYVFYHFSIKELIKKKTIIIVGISSVVLDYFFTSSILFIVFIYTFLLIHSDYYFSQSNLKKTNFVFKFLLLITSLLLFFKIHIIIIIYIKIIIICFFYIFSNYLKVNKIGLKIKSPLKYSLFTCTIYFGSLFLISIIADILTVKIFYIFMQLFLGFKLKLFDLEIRSLSSTKLNLNLLMNIFSFIFIVVLSFFYNEFLILVIYIISALSLDYVKKEFIK